MATERKNVMVSARLPASLVERMDYVVRNNTDDIRSRSEVIQAAVTDWLPPEEQKLVVLGLTPPKKAR